MFHVFLHWSTQCKVKKWDALAQALLVQIGNFCFVQEKRKAVTLNTMELNPSDLCCTVIFLIALFLVSPPASKKNNLRLLETAALFAV